MSRQPSDPRQNANQNPDPHTPENEKCPTPTPPGEAFWGTKAPSDERINAAVAEMEALFAKPSPVEGLTAKQLIAIDLTVQGYSDADISKKIPIDRKTLWRWKTRDSNYRQAMAEARTQRYVQTVDRYQGVLSKATDVLLAFLSDSVANNRYRAAQTLFNMAGTFKPPLPKASPADDSFPEPPLPYKMG